MSAGVNWMSPLTEAMPLRISRRKPEDTDTAMIMTRKEIATETIAILPLKRSFFAMKDEAFTTRCVRALTPDGTSDHPP